MKKLVVPFIVFFMLISLALAATMPSNCPSTITGYDSASLLVYDRFEYSDGVNSHSWLTSPDPDFSPLPSLFGSGSNAMTAYNQDRSIYWNSSNLIYDNTHFVVSYDFYIKNDSIRSAAAVDIFIKSQFSSNDGIHIRQYHLSDNSTNITTTNTAGVTETCLGRTNLTNGTMIIDFDTLNNVYSIYLNNNIVGNCYNKQIHTNGSNMPVQRFVFATGFDAGEKNFQQLDNIVVAIGGVTCNNSVFDASLRSHILWADNFNYAASMYTEKGWYVFTGSYSIDTDFTPTDNQLDLRGSDTILPSHQTGSFPVYYEVGVNGYYLESQYSPVFSSEMDVNITSTHAGIPDSCFTYASYSGGNVPIYRIYLCHDKNAYYQADRFNTLNYTMLCSGCVPQNTTFPFKVSTYFAQRRIFPFNSTVLSDKIDVFVNGGLAGTISGFLEPDPDLTQYLSIYYIVKNTDAEFIVDDYYVYLGTDKDVNNAAYYYKSLRVPANQTEQLLVPNPQSGDMADAIIGMYSMIGLKSAVSRVLVGLFLLFILLAFVAVVFMTYGMSPHPLVMGLVAIIGVIGCVYLQLFPVWIPILIGLFTIAGIIFYALSKSAGA